MILTGKSEEPSVEQWRGCGFPGHRITLPLSSINRNTSQDVEQLVGDLLVKLRYGVFAGLRQESGVTSRHFSFCNGLSVRDVINRHEDFTGNISQVFTKPEFVVTMPGNPRFVIVVENSHVMDSDHQWHFIQTALRKLIIEDLPDSAEVGLVLFNKAAHIAQPLVQLSHHIHSPARQSLALRIKSRHNLYPSNQGASCLVCGISKAVEALQVSRSVGGGAIILVSKGGKQALGKNEKDIVARLTRKHQVKLFSVSLAYNQHLNDIAPASRGQSWTISEDGLTRKQGQSLQFYLNLIDIFRSIAVKTLHQPDYLVIF